MPLSEHEQRLLEQLEQQLRADDPKFASSLASNRGKTVSTRHIVVGTLVAIAGILILLVGVSQQFIPIGVLGFLVMGAGVYWATARGSRKVRGDGQTPGNGHNGSGQRNSFMSNLEDRWDQRRRDQP